MSSTNFVPDMTSMSEKTNILIQKLKKQTDDMLKKYEGLYDSENCMSKSAKRAKRAKRAKPAKKKSKKSKKRSFSLTLESIKHLRSDKYGTSQSKCDNVYSKPCHCLNCNDKVWFRKVDAKFIQWRSKEEVYFFYIARKFMSINTNEIKSPFKCLGDAMVGKKYLNDQNKIKPLLLEQSSKRRCIKTKI